MILTSSITSPATTNLVLNSNCSTRASLLDALPEEIVVRIFEWCDVGGVLVCQRTCRAFRNMIEGSASLRYKLALSENGMCDEPRSRMAVAEKLELLKAHAAGWRRLHAAQPEWVASLVGWNSPEAVSGNILVFSRECKGAKEHEGNVPTTAPVEAHVDLLVVRVPSPLRRIEGAQWMLWLPEGARGLCIDAAQDLLIYERDRTISVRTLSTGVVHPLVVGHSCCFKLWEGYSGLSFDVFDLCVKGDYIAATTHIYFISIWNWKTGALVSYQVSDANFSSFDFLDEHHILYADYSEDTICMYDLRRGIDLTGRLKTKAGHRRFQLELPLIHRGCTSRYIQIQRNTLPMRIRDEELHVDSGGAPPFHADPRERLVVLRIICANTFNFGKEQFELHVPAQALLEHFAARRDVSADAVVPWSAWRADVAATPLHMLPYPPQAHMITYGMRAVSHPPDRDEYVLHLYSYPPRRASTGGAGSGAGTRQSIPLRDELPENVPENGNLLSTLCEDGLLCFQLDPSWRSWTKDWILHAYWFTPRVQ